MNTFPILLGALCVYALAYRYYSAFIAAKALALDDRRTTPPTFVQTGITTLRRQNGFCSDITLLRLQERVLSSAPPWLPNLDSRRASSGFWSAAF